MECQSQKIVKPSAKVLYFKIKNTKSILQKTDSQISADEAIKNSDIRIILSTKYTWASLLEVVKKLGYKGEKLTVNIYQFHINDINIIINKYDNTFINSANNKKSYGAMNFLMEILNYPFNKAIDFIDKNKIKCGF